MLMLKSELDIFIKDNLGPAFKKAGITTKIVLYDHNLDHPLYPLSILRIPPPTSTSTAPASISTGAPSTP